MAVVVNHTVVHADLISMTKKARKTINPTLKTIKNYEKINILSISLVDGCRVAVGLLQR